MEYHIWFYMLLLGSTRSSLLDSFSTVEREATRRLPDYIVYEGRAGDDIEECSDPCVLNWMITDPGYVKAYRQETLLCSEVPVHCTKEEINSKYPTIDGSCNNLIFPSWGKSQTCHRRILPHLYADGKSYPRKSCLGGELPNARVVSNILHKETRFAHDNHTIHFMEWGQVIAHDFSLTDTKGFPERGRGSCCDPYPRVDDDCAAESVPPDDPFYIGKRDCLSFERSRACPLCKRVRHSLNEATSYHDLSLVYGNTDNQSRSLRYGKRGRLLTQEVPGVGSLPPGVMKSGRCEALNSTHRCFVAGDNRITKNPLLTCLHIILLRNHNNLCRRLERLNRHWNDERLFQEARKINIAQSQFITFGRYIQHELGPKFTSQFSLDVLPGNSFTNYDPVVDASITDEFTNAALRYGHTMIPDILLEQNPLTEEFDLIRLRDYYLWPFEFYTGQLDRLTFGMTERPPSKHDLFLGTDVRDFLYDRRLEKEFEGSDLAATSIVRGREHGFPGYTYYLKYLFDHEVHSFCDLKKFIPTNALRKMMKVYKSVHDVDLYTAGLAEHRIEGGIVGPTFAALLILQYKKLKYGDRYYFEHGGQAGSLTSRQLNEIKKTRFSQILCQTTKIRKVQRDAFLPISDGNMEVACEYLPKLDLKAWKERREVSEIKASSRKRYVHDVCNGGNKSNCG